MKLNGCDVPWPVIVLCLTMLANGAVAYWRLGDISDQLNSHKHRQGHPEVISDVLLLEQSVRRLEEDIKELEKRVEKLK